MDAETDFEALLVQIKAELHSAGHLNSGTISDHGATVVVSADLPAGWVGVIDSQGFKAFGPASDILGLVRNYVRWARDNADRPGYSWWHE